MEDSAEKCTVDHVNDWYDKHMFGARSSLDKIGFFNLGYWNGVNDNLEMAQINLIETLASFFSRGKNSNVLDVACGKGAGSKFLTKYFDPTNITGINISERQLQICKVVAPECNFYLMDAVNMEFADSSFDNVLCIEGGMHFMTREQFFSEAYRVLRPGGRLATSDILYDEYLLDVLGPSHPKENYLPNVGAYEGSLERVGFRYVRVEDGTEASLNQFRQFFIRKMERELGRDGDSEDCESIKQSRRLMGHLKAYCLAYAIK